MLPAANCAFNTFCTTLWVLLLIWHCEYNWMDAIKHISQFKKMKFMEGKGLALGLVAGNQKVSSDYSSFQKVP